MCIYIQFGNTPYFLASLLQQWFNIYAPLRLDSNQGQLPTESSMDTPVNQVDVGRVFKGKVEKK